MSNLQKMYPAQRPSRITQTTAVLDNRSATIPVVDVSMFPDAPNLATIFDRFGQAAETVRYGGKSSNALTEVTRGFAGTAAQDWPAGADIARVLSNYDHDTFLLNIITLQEAAQADRATPFIPDYAATSGVNVINEDDTEWTAKADGFLYVEAGAQSVDAGWLRLNVWINDVRVSKNLATSTLSDGHRLRVSDLLPIGKGDTVRVRVWRFDPRIENFYVMARFIPPRPAVVGTGQRGPRGTRGKPGQGVPTGGKAGQVLMKVSDDDFDAVWVDLPMASSEQA